MITYGTQTKPTHHPTTFRLPDFRARFIRGLDNGVGYDPDRLLGTEELPTLVPGYDNNDDYEYFHYMQPQYENPYDYFNAGGTTYTWANIGYLSTDAYHNGIPGQIDYPDRDAGGCWSGDALNTIRDYKGSLYSTTYSNNKSTRLDFYYTSYMRDKGVEPSTTGVATNADETTILPNTWYAPSRPRNIALRAVIKYK